MKTNRWLLLLLILPLASQTLYAQTSTAYKYFVTWCNGTVRDSFVVINGPNFLVRAHLGNIRNGIPNRHIYDKTQKRFYNVYDYKKTITYFDEVTGPKQISIKELDSVKLVNGVVSKKVEMEANGAAFKNQNIWAFQDASIHLSNVFGYYISFFMLYDGYVLTEKNFSCNSSIQHPQCGTIYLVGQYEYEDYNFNPDNFLKYKAKKVKPKFIAKESCDEPTKTQFY